MSKKTAIRSKSAPDKNADKVVPAKGSLIKGSGESVNKFSLVSTPFSVDQVLRLFSRTPKQYIKKRPAKGGGEWEYVSGAYIQKILNYTFGFLWDFEIVNEDVQFDQIVVRGRLTVKYMDSNGDIKPMLSKEQYGRADIKFKKDSRVALDYGNDKKAAATDALKKCASQFGIAGDIYAKDEFRDIEPPKSEYDIVKPTNALDEKTVSALKALNIDMSTITTQEEAILAIKNSAQKRSSK